MGTFRGVPPELLETLGLDPEGDEDAPDEPSGPYELPHRIAEFSPPKGVAGSGDDRPGGPASASPPTGAATRSRRKGNEAAAERPGIVPGVSFDRMEDSVSDTFGAHERTLTYTAAFRFEEGWWWAQAVEVPEAFGQGRTLDEAKASVSEAVASALALRVEEGEPLPPSGQVTVGPITVPAP